MKGKRIYFTESELLWIRMSMENQDCFGDQEEEKANRNIYRKVLKALSE